ncbi:hypothetical protein [Ancylobacter lacus]|uniref:hypothetical protein n=1 Tax=Ancylobacter lacus TaxID=2579970 RepID=UPI001BCACD8F|nr:hypothetical protein [Ancylobacter lacus]MBS7540678.1 hypothetical protein [Ancylobacter lacus]
MPDARDFLRPTRPHVATRAAAACLLAIMTVPVRAETLENVQREAADIQRQIDAAVACKKGVIATLQGIDRDPGCKTPNERCKAMAYRAFDTDKRCIAMALAAKERADALAARVNAEARASEARRAAEAERARKAQQAQSSQPAPTPAVPVAKPPASTSGAGSGKCTPVNPDGSPCAVSCGTVVDSWTSNLVCSSSCDASLTVAYLRSDSDGRTVPRTATVPAHADRAAVAQHEKASRYQLIGPTCK